MLTADIPKQLIINTKIGKENNGKITIDYVYLQSVIGRLRSLKFNTSEINFRQSGAFWFCHILRWFVKLIASLHSFASALRNILVYFKFPYCQIRLKIKRETDYLLATRVDRSNIRVKYPKETRSIKGHSVKWPISFFIDKYQLTLIVNVTSFIFLSRSPNGRLH